MIDLTTPLSEDTPIIDLPPELGRPWRFERELIRRYEDAARVFYWNNILLSEHTGGFLRTDPLVARQRARQRLAGTAVPPRRSGRHARHLGTGLRGRDFLQQRHHVEAWQEEHGDLPQGGWLLYRTGWDAREGEQDLPQ